VADALLISNLLLWAVVIILALLVLALTRQVGILHERVAPAGALMPINGPKVGESTRALELETLNGGRIRVGGVNDGETRATLVLFISPSCPVCKSLVPTAIRLARDESLRLVFASDGDGVQRHNAYVRELGLEAYPYVLSADLGMTYQVGKLPFALLIAADGVLKGKGLVNTREHLESLLESMDRGVATIQEYAGKLQAHYDKASVESTP